MSYLLLAWETQCNKIKLLQKKAVRVLFFQKTPIAHTEPISLNLLTCILVIFLNCTINFREINFQIIPTIFDKNTASMVIIFPMTSFAYLSSKGTLEKLIQHINAL